ncbi:hypothetical protein U9M48_006795 [Paspalum notatum var. saurae]|uniref:Reverse transcriptase Ty1/copia-type domain-containing protein n=1 Tax=Paspalum notatum var. saurae TaxID=547442 RepID=A0AAQ3Q0H1_PASNO
MYVPFPMVEEPYFSMPAEAAPPVQPTVVATPAVDVGSSGTTANEQEIVPVPEPRAATPEPLAPDAAETEGSEQEIVPNSPPPEQPQVEEQDVIVRRSQRVRKSAIPDDYEVYVSEDIALEGDPTTYEEAMRSPDSSKWLAAMEDEMRSMDTNKVWDLEEIPKGAKKVGCKWVYKTKRDSKGNIERYKARLVAKGFTQREGIDYTETFSPVSSKDSFRIIMALVAHFDLELHQMDVKTAFLNGVLNENVFMAQPKGFVMKGKENLGCHLKKSIYGLKQASRQWYLKFDETIRKFGFKENDEDNCIYAKFRNGRYIFLVLYVDDILLASSDMDLLLETKSFLCSNYDMKDLGEASYVLGIQIHRDRNRCILGLSQKTYTENVLKRYGMQACKAGPVPIANGDNLGIFNVPRMNMRKNI